jgi:hypothetical protein
MTALASEMNERKRESEGRHRLLHWQQRIGNRFKSPLVQPHRQLVREGSMVGPCPQFCVGFSMCCLADSGVCRHFLGSSSARRPMSTRRRSRLPTARRSALQTRPVWSRFILSKSKTKPSLSKLYFAATVRLGFRIPENRLSWADVLSNIVQSSSWSETLPVYQTKWSSSPSSDWRPSGPENKPPRSLAPMATWSGSLTGGVTFLLRRPISPEL